MIISEKSAGGVRLHLTGTNRLDLFITGILQDEIMKMLKGDAGNITLDLGNIIFIDSVGFSVLIDISHKLREKGKRFCLSHVTPEVRELISLLKMENTLQFNDPGGFVVT